MSAGTVLVVDYHPEIINFTKAALAHADYDVLSAPTGQDGLGILEARPDVDLVISEVMMPGGISGVELVDKVRERFPETAVMLMTGFTEESLDPEIPLLKKPFAASTLVGRVQRVLLESRRQTEHLRSSCRKLRSQYEVTNDLRPEITAAIEDSRQARQQSRRIRSEWLRTRLLEASAAIPTVMVAEDDVVSRYAVCHFLQSIGLNVLQASNGAVALDLLQQRKGRVDMIITDIRMPAMDGLELAATVSKQFPRTHIVFASGEDVDVPYPMVRKPFDPEELLGAIAEKLLQRMQERVI